MRDRSFVAVMRFSSLAAALGGLCAARAQIISSKDPQPPSKYPIGAVREPFAKVSGRLFDVNGTVGYFSGQPLDSLPVPQAYPTRHERLVPWSYHVQ